MTLKFSGGKLLFRFGHLCTTCCRIAHFKCNPEKKICSQTNEPIGDGVYSSLQECQEGCGFTPCETEGCSFRVQFYYLKEWATHFCDRAVYRAYAGDRLLGTVDLNNGSGGDSRYSAWFNITAADFNAEKCSYDMSLVCALPEGCHTGLAGLKTSNGKDYPNMIGDTWSLGANEICNNAP